MQSYTHLSNNALHPLPLQPPHLPSESLNLPIAIQRPPVIFPQAPNHVALCLLNPLVQLLHLLPLLQLSPQPLHILLHRISAQLSQAITCGFLCRRGRGFLGGEFRGKFFKVFAGTLLEFLKFTSDAGLDMKFEGFGAGGIGLELC